MVIRGVHVVLRRAAQSDVDAIVELLCAPGVAEWWSGVSYEDVMATTIEGGGDTVGFVIELDGALAGFIQHWEEKDGADGTGRDGLLTDLLHDDLTRTAP